MIGAKWISYASARSTSYHEYLSGLTAAETGVSQSIKMRVFVYNQTK